MGVKIRKARESDRVAILRMDRACFPDDKPIKIEDGELWWIAVDESTGKPVAFAGAQEWESRERGGKIDQALYVHRMGVVKSHRGQRLQARLLRAQVAEARRRGFHEVWSMTAHSNTPSMNTFIASGFKTWIPWMWDGWRHPWKPEYDSDQGWVFWRKSLRWLEK